MNRKTALILASAVGLVAAAVLLGHKRPGAGPATSTVTGTVPVTGPVCGPSTAPARASGDFGHGDMTAALSSAKVLRAGDGELFLSVDLAARDARGGQRPPLNLAIVVDRSGSMDGEKLERVRDAATGIVSRLTPADRVALVQYDDTAQVVVPSTRTDDAGKARLRAAIAGLYSGGSTNLHGGMTLGRDEIMRELAPGRVNRVVLLSDGLANVGIQDTPTLARIAGDAAEKGVRITTVGVGLDYNEDLLEAVAESGRGNYYYVRDAAGLQAVFAGEVKSMQATVATRAELRLVPACSGVEIAEVYGYQFRRDGAAVVVPLADVFGGDHRKVVARLRVPVELAGREGVVSAVLSYDDMAGGGRKTTALALGAEVSDDTAAVTASADKDVMGYVVEVETARSMREAAERYDRGDVAAANAGIRAARVQAQAKAKKYALPAAQMAPTLDVLDEAETGVNSYAPGSAGGKALVKGTKSSARTMMK